MIKKQANKTSLTQDTIILAYPGYPADWQLLPVHGGFKALMMLSGFE